MNLGEIMVVVLVVLYVMVMEKLVDCDVFVCWFGVYNFMFKYFEVEWGLEELVLVEDICVMIVGGVVLWCNFVSWFLFVCGDDVLLFVDGDCFDCVGEVVGLVE